MHLVCNVRWLAIFGVFILVPLLLSCSNAPTKAEPPLSIDGVWQESFLVPMVGVLQIEGAGGDVDMLDTLCVVATMTMREGSFTVVTDHPASALVHYSESAPIEGSYQVHGDTITFTQSNGAMTTQDFDFDLQRETMKLSYLGVTDTLESGATVMVVPSGCLPWHNVWLKTSGTFQRVE
jgi:hypothetical protein